MSTGSEVAAEAAAEAEVAAGEAIEAAGEAIQAAGEVAGLEAALEHAEQRVEAAEETAEAIAEAAMATETGRRIGELETICHGLRERERVLTEDLSSTRTEVARLLGLLEAMALTSMSKSEPVIVQPSSTSEPLQPVELTEATPEVLPEPSAVESPARRRVRRL